MRILQTLFAALFLSPFARMETCKPTLRVSEPPVGGGRAASVLPPPGCHCRKLNLSVRAISDRSKFPGQLCRNRTMSHCTWLHLSPGANYSLKLEGWYRPNAKDCRCVNRSCRTVTRGTAHFVPGLRPDSWNAPVSIVRQPTGRISVKVVRQFGTDVDAGRIFFRQLTIRLLHLDDSFRNGKSIASETVNCSSGSDQRSTEDGHCSVADVGNGSAGLLPGLYVVELTPVSRLYPVDGWSRAVPANVSADLVSFTPVDAGRDSSLPPLLFILIFLSTFLLTFVAWVVWRVWSRRTRPCPAPLDLGTVLLLPAHNRAPELTAIKAHLQRLGARTRDFQERDVLYAFQCQPCVPAVLELPALRQARPVFVCAERDAPPLRSPAAELWDSVLRFVRNWRPTELVVLTTAGGPGPETAGLTAARAFVVPEDLDKLAQYLHETRAPTSPTSLPKPRSASSGV